SLSSGDRSHLTTSPSHAGAAETFADSVVDRSELLGPTKCRPCIVPLVELEIRPAHSHLVLLRVRRGQARPDEHRQSLAIPLQVVEAPRHLPSQDRHLRGLGGQQMPRSLQRLLERRQREIVLATLELGRAQAVQGVDVVGIPVERRPEGVGSQLIASEAQPAPAQTAVETLPSWLSAKCGLERDGRPAKISQEVLGPREHRPRLIVLGIERHRLGEAIARLLILVLPEQGAAPREVRLGLHAPAHALKESRRRNQLNGGLNGRRQRHPSRPAPARPPPPAAASWARSAASRARNVSRRTIVDASNVGVFRARAAASAARDASRDASAASFAASFDASATALLRQPLCCAASPACAARREASAAALAATWAARSGSARS